MVPARSDPAGDRNRNPRSQVFWRFPVKSLVLLEKRWLHTGVTVLVERATEMFEGASGSNTPTRSPVQETQLDQEWLVHIHDGVGLFCSRSCERINAHRPT